MSYYCIIPARSGSKGVPDKNIKEINGHPLLAYSIYVARKTKDILGTIVSTDSAEYRQIASKYMADSILRPDYACTDSAGDVDYLLHFIYAVNLKPEDNIVLLRPTTPVRDADIVYGAIDKFETERYISRGMPYQSLRSVHRLNEPPEKMVKIQSNAMTFQKQMIYPYSGNIEDMNNPRQHFPPCYLPNGYVDIINVNTILKTKTAYGDLIMSYETPRAPEIDNEEDIEYIEYLVKKNESQFGGLNAFTTGS